MRYNIRPNYSAATPSFFLLVWLVIGCNGDFFNDHEQPADTSGDKADFVDAPSQTPVDMAVQTTELPINTTETTDSDTPPTAGLNQPAPRAAGNDCVAPSREEYMAGFGVTSDNKDLSDPNVVAAKAHTILFVFDKSGSMKSEWNEDGGSKWEIARDTMISAVSPYQQYLSAGAIFFPLEDNTGEVSLIDSGSQINYANASSFLNVWDDNMGMYAASGGTPLMDALEATNDAIALACAEGLLAWPFKVTLITDGMPDYWDAQRGLELIKDWYDRGIPTLVVGMPGSDSATQILSDIAAVGSGGEIQLDGTVDDTTATAEEIVYTEESAVDDFEEDMRIACE